MIDLAGSNSFWAFPPGRSPARLNVRQTLMIGGDKILQEYTTLADLVKVASYI